jgi:hypothetical protein
MSEEGFLGRWSRLKRKRALDDAEATAPVERTEEGEGAAPAAEPDPVDLSELPPVESLGPGSDFSVFMRAGVPKELRLRALRKLWVSDPDFLNYKTLADYDWDYNAPGYGQMLPIDDAKRYLGRLLGEEAPEPSPEEDGPAEAEPAGAESAASALPPPASDGPADIGLPPTGLAEDAPPPEPSLPASPERPEPDPAPVPRRRHGGAMPT